MTQNDTPERNDTPTTQAGNRSELENAAFQFRAWHLFGLSPLLPAVLGRPHEVLAGGELSTILRLTGAPRARTG